MNVSRPEVGRRLLLRVKSLDPLVRALFPLCGLLGSCGQPP